METITTNKKFITAAVVLVSLLSLLVVAMFINEVKESRYIGRGAEATTISVSGEGEVMAVPDIATITVNIMKDAKTTTAATTALNDMVEKTLAYLKTQNIEEKDIKSEYGGVNPRYDYNDKIRCVTYPCQPGTPTIVGYNATQSITIKIRNADNSNQVRTGLANLGITDISGPTFSIDDETGIKEEARAKAIEDAKRKAEVLADQLGVKLGRVVNFAENTGGYPIYYKTSLDAAAGSAAPEVAPVLPKGENRITSMVTVTYELK